MGRKVWIGVSGTLLTLGLIYVILALSTEDCPEVELQGNFDAVRYSGLWYEHARDKKISFEKGDC